MLDTDTKRRIDTCRDILVGKVPDPKSQVEQITVALIYKFMDDMDLQSEEMGGERKFFTKEFERYRWAKLVAPGVSGQDMLNTYSEALTRMVENEGLPQLFRSIFRNAYLPYRDPETLRAFLREINTFTYDHSEKLGDAFEYLLSVLGSQGDAGQFRTPRHIIDFMVEIIDPQKHEVIMDPACGTAGFLISAYKHILKRNSSNIANGNTSDEDVDVAQRALENPMRYPGDLLTPDDRARLAHNIRGYDISPDMVRLSLVNLYLHGFANPKIEEYDTLSSEDKWTEMADIILANPPFMSPKGGIKPHNRFSVQSKKAEVLFADYILEHLTANGRAAFIVPDGIVSNPPRAYMQLRKMLVDNGLFAVVSLHNSVFQPYAVAKTSILFVDKNTRATDGVLFAVVRDDGFERGQQRRSISANDLPALSALCRTYRNAVLCCQSTSSFQTEISAVVPKKKLGSSYDLFASKYVAAAKVRSGNYVRIGSLFNIEKGTLQSSKAIPGPFKFITAAEEPSSHQSYKFDCEALVFAMGASGSLGRTHYVDGKFIASDLCFVLTPLPDKSIDLRFYHAYFNSIRSHIVRALAKGGAKLSINKKDFSLFEILDLDYQEQRRIGDQIKTESEAIQNLSDEIVERRNNILELIASVDPDNSETILKIEALD